MKTITIKQNNKSYKIRLHFQHKTSGSKRIFSTLMATTCSVKSVLFRSLMYAVNVSTSNEKLNKAKHNILSQR